MRASRVSRRAVAAWRNHLQAAGSIRAIASWIALAQPSSTYSFIRKTGRSPVHPVDAPTGPTIYWWIVMQHEPVAAQRHV